MWLNRRSICLTPGRVGPSAPNTPPNRGMLIPCNEGVGGKPMGVAGVSVSLPNVRPWDGCLMGPMGSFCKPKLEAIPPEMAK